MVREILNTKKVREKSENFLILGQLFGSGRYIVFYALRMIDDFFISLTLLAQHYYILMFILENVFPETLKHFIFELNS